MRMAQHGICRLFFFVVTLLLLPVAGCKRVGGGDAPRPAPSVYYWRTVFRLSSAERDFLRTYRVERIYLRYFDVLVRDGRPMPVSTLAFEQPVPAETEIVPVVFIDEACLRADTAALGERIVRRIGQMCATHDVKNVREVQIDCDWTARSQHRYFSLLSDIRQRLRARGDSLSVTIRLHQLSMSPPPAEYGVLMMYNTGDFRKPGDRNPILDFRDVAPYLPSLADYPLPLCAAYPNYAWQLLFRDDDFKALLHDEDLTDSTLYRRLSDSTFEVISARDLPYAMGSESHSVHVVPGECVRCYRSSAAQVLRVKRALEELRPGIGRQTVVYHLDGKNLNRFKQQEYEKIFHP